jgi:hypothetical protein
VALLLSSTPSSAAVAGLKGKLPPASAPKLLPGLTTVVISGQPGVTGPVPASWADLQQLEDVRLHDNDLNGELPDSWSALKSLKVRHMLWLLCMVIVQGFGCAGHQSEWQRYHMHNGTSASVVGAMCVLCYVQ